MVPHEPRHCRKTSHRSARPPSVERCRPLPQNRKTAKPLQQNATRRDLHDLPTYRIFSRVVRPHRLTVRTPDFQSDNESSTLSGGTTSESAETQGVSALFCFPYRTVVSDGFRIPENGGGGKQKAENAMRRRPLIGRRRRIRTCRIQPAAEGRSLPQPVRHPIHDVRGDGLDLVYGDLECKCSSHSLR